MSLCGVCHLDSKKHSKKLWTLHQQTQTCMFCQKKGSEHSEKLWEMHNLTVERGRKGQKLYPLTLGFARTGIARVVSLNADPPYDKDLIPIYMSCTECGRYLGSTEEDNADSLDGMCLNCFREQTEQTDAWYNIPPVLKGKQCTVCSINFFGRSDSDKCGKHRKEGVIFDPDWLMKKQAKEDADC